MRTGQLVCSSFLVLLILLGFTLQSAALSVHRASHFSEMSQAQITSQQSTGLHQNGVCALCFLTHTNSAAVLVSAETLYVQNNSSFLDTALSFYFIPEPCVHPSVRAPPARA